MTPDVARRDGDELRRLSHELSNKAAVVSGFSSLLVQEIDRLLSEK